MFEITDKDLKVSEQLASKQYNLLQQSFKA